MNDPLLARAKALKLYGLMAHWDEVAATDWVEPMIAWEEAERARRSLENRLRAARLGRFKPMVDFDWTWPKRCNRQAIDELMKLRFLNDAANVIFLGPNGVGKSTLAKNIVQQAVLAGHTARFVGASQMLNELAAQDGDLALRRRIAQYARPQLLVIDEVGYLTYGNRHADLMFEIVNRRYEDKSTIVTTNKPFAEWNEIFPSAACVVSLVDRLVHHAEIVTIDGESYRLKEAKEAAKQRQLRRKNPSPKDPS